MVHAVQYQYSYCSITVLYQCQCLRLRLCVCLCQSGSQQPREAKFLFYAGALAGLIQGPRATSLTDGLNRPQMSYSLPAQLPDPDQHMHEVYLAAQAAAAAGSNAQVRHRKSALRRYRSAVRRINLH